jgi:signal transduction histidine kinase
VQYWQYRNFATCNSKGEPYVICSAQDVTDKERVANTLRKAKGELEAEVLLRTGQLQTTNAELSRTKAELDLFLYRASHDLKGPLCSMEGLLQLAQLQQAPLAQEQYLTLMQQTVRKLNWVLESLVSYSKNTHQRIAYQAVDFDLLLESVRQSCRTLKGFERVSLQTHLHTPVPFYSDAERVFTVLRNVISNSITFQNYALPQPMVTVWITTSADWVTILVRDNGLGIEADKLSTLFQMFTKSSSQSAGSGLGLFVTGEIVKKLGGNISLQSQPGKGTQVSIYIPSGTAKETPESHSF